MQKTTAGLIYEQLEESPAAILTKRVYIITINSNLVDVCAKAAR